MLFRLKVRRVLVLILQLTDFFMYSVRSSLAVKAHFQNHDLESIMVAGRLHLIIPLCPIFAAPVRNKRISTKYNGHFQTGYSEDIGTCTPQQPFEEVIISLQDYQNKATTNKDFQRLLAN